MFITCILKYIEVALVMDENEKLLVSEYGRHELNWIELIAFVTGYHYTLLVLETFLLSLLARYAFRFQDPPYKYNQIGKVPLLFFCVPH